MAKLMKSIAVFSLIITVILAVLYVKTGTAALLSLAITFGTTFYHFAMRLLVGAVFNAVMKNKADCRKRWFRVSKREAALYEKLKVQKWKSKMPTYHAALFDPRMHTWDEIAQAMCQAELVHETIVVFSFLPILAGIRFGAYPVFIITSVLAAAFDMMFVIMQRYNRPRVLLLAERRRALKSTI